MGYKLKYNIDVYTNNLDFEEIKKAFEEYGFSIELNSVNDVDSYNLRETVQPRNAETIIIPVKYGGKLPVSPERE